MKSAGQNRTAPDEKHGKTKQDAARHNITQRNNTQRDSTVRHGTERNRNQTGEDGVRARSRVVESRMSRWLRVNRTRSGAGTHTRFTSGLSAHPGRVCANARIKAPPPERRRGLGALRAAGHRHRYSTRRKRHLKRYEPVLSLQVTQGFQTDVPFIRKRLHFGELAR